MPMWYFCLLILFSPFVKCANVIVGSRSYDVSQLRVDNPRVDVTELPEYSAVLFNFSIYHHDGYRRRPLVGIKKSDLTIQFSDEPRMVDPAESSYDVTMVEGQLETITKFWKTAEATTVQHGAQRIRPVLLRYVTVVIDMSESMFKADGRLSLTRMTLKALFSSLADAKLPGVVVGVYAFADLDSLQLVNDYTPDVESAREAAEMELALSREQRVAKYGVATDLYRSIFSTLEAVESTLKTSPAQTSLANVFIITDGRDETRVITAETFNLRLSRTYQSWTQNGLDIVTQPILLSVVDADHSLAKVQFNGGVIDGRSPATATKEFEKIVADIAQNTPASYSMLVCETARDTAPRQRRDLLLQGHRILSYDFSPAGFRRQGAAKCDASALLTKLTQQAQASGIADDVLDAEL